MADNDHREDTDDRDAAEPRIVTAPPTEGRPASHAAPEQALETAAEAGSPADPGELPLPPSLPAGPSGPHEEPAGVAVEASPEPIAAPVPFEAPLEAPLQGHAEIEVERLDWLAALHVAAQPTAPPPEALEQVPAIAPEAGGPADPIEPPLPQPLPAVPPSRDYEGPVAPALEPRWEPVAAPVSFEVPLDAPRQAIAEAERLDQLAALHEAAQPPAPAPEMPRVREFESGPLLPPPQHQAPAADLGSVVPGPLPHDDPSTRRRGPAAPEPQSIPQPQARENVRARALRLIRTGARYALYGAAGYLALVVLLIGLFRFVDPPGSTLMLLRRIGGAEIQQTWLPIGSISPNLVRAVVVAEDGRFCEHWGIDVAALREAIERGAARGASTISMQVVKNLFLWPWKSYIRKLIELPLTMLMELAWPKWRILEVYLNIAEWGPGIFGAEAAARHHFQKSAGRLSEQEAALLAASLPNPVRRDAGDPGPRTSRKARVIQARMRAAGPVAACVLDR